MWWFLSYAVVFGLTVVVGGPSRLTGAKTQAFRKRGRADFWQ
jgi:hypothetical protein